MVSKMTDRYLEFENFGQLLANLESSESAYQANLREAERQETLHGAIFAYHSRLQANALLFHPDPSRMPGIDRIEAFINEEYGTKLTAESVRKLRGMLCRILHCGTEQIDKLSMVEAANLLEIEGRRPTIARLRSECPSSNLSLISKLIGSYAVEAVFDPYLDNRGLSALRDIISVGEGRLSPSIRLLTSSKALQKRNGIPRLSRSFVDQWLKEVEATSGEMRLMGSEGEHRRFLLMSDKRSLVLGASLNGLNKNEAASVDSNKEDLDFFEESWGKSTSLK